MTYSHELDAYGQLLAGQPWAREHLDPDQLKLYEQDLDRARAEMTRAYLERGAALTAGPREPPLSPPGVEPIETIGHTTNQPDEVW